MSPPRPAVFLHVGAPKTGTTYLQQTLHRHRTALRRAGLLYPGSQQAHFWASQDLRGVQFKGQPDRHVPGAWRRVVDEVRRWPARTLIDHETFAAARPAAIDRALRDLEFADVHVIFTARDLSRQLPAAWQERIKNGSSGRYGEFLAAVRDTRFGGARSERWFWTLQDAPEVLARWGRDLPPERLHLVTVPPRGSDPSLLWRRFAGVLGIDPDAYDSTPQEANPSLGAAEAAALRRFNAALVAADIPWPAYSSLFKQRVAAALAARGGTPIAVPEEHFGWVSEWSERAVERLRDAGYHVVGDLDELVPRMRPNGADPDTAPAEDEVEAAVAGMVSLAEIAVSSRTAVAAIRRAERGPLTRRVEDIVARVGWLRALRDAYRRRTG